MPFFYINKLPVTAEVVLDINKENLTYYTVDSFINSSPVATPFVATCICVDHHLVMAQQSLRCFSFGHRDSISLYYILDWVADIFC